MADVAAIDATSFAAQLDAAWINVSRFVWGMAGTSNTSTLKVPESLVVAVKAIVVV